MGQGGTVESRPGRVCRVLVVDDVPDVRRMHTWLLYGSGMEVATAENGVQALDAARRTAPDVIVTDVNMPVMDGLDLCRRLRAEAATRDIVVVVVTAEELDQTAFDAGCDAVLRKPCSRTRLLSTIRLLLERR